MPEIALMPNALRVLEARYLRRDAAGQVVETPEAMFRRVAAHVAAMEKPYGDRPDTAAETCYDALARPQFLPNSAGTEERGTTTGQLAACFVLPVEDSLDQVFGTLHDARAHPADGRRRRMRLLAAPSGRRPRDVDGRSSNGSLERAEPERQQLRTRRSTPSREEMVDCSTVKRRTPRSRLLCVDERTRARPSRSHVTSLEARTLGKPRASSQESLRRQSIRPARRVPGTR